MLDDDLRWFHITVGTLNSWLPGCEKGFRSRGHKIHSSGDHRHPPPAGEHAGLLRHSRSLSGRVLILPKDLRPIIGQHFVDRLLADRRRLLVISVSGVHIHMHVELPNVKVKAQIGEYKRAVSAAVTSRIPGRVWARSCGVEPIKDAAHQHNTFGYVGKHRFEGAWVWTFREGALPYPIT